MRRISFLPAFFTGLTIVFCVALYLRIRSYESQPPRVRPAERAETRAPNATEPEALSPQETVTLVETIRSRPGTRVEPKTTQTVASETPAPTQIAPRPKEPPPSREKPSLLSRIVKPIVNAISGGGSKTQTATGSQQSPTPTAAGGSSPRSPDNTTTRESDKSSDSVPPQLVGIEFIPAQVRDGEETTLIIQAYDELAGVRSVSGTIAAPSGAVQGFACQREGDANRYVARITVPKDAAEGVWRVNYLSMIDNASNAATFSAAQGMLPATASFRVTSSRPDALGPTLVAVWVDRRSIKAGEKNTIHVQAEDDKSGLNLVSGVFQSPSKNARVGFVCRASGGNAWDCEFNSPACGDCGDWQLEQIQLQDKANNMSTIRNDNELVAGVQMDISSDHCDATPPALQAIALDRDLVGNNGEGTITVTATLSDDICGVLNVSGQATGPVTAGVPPRLYFSFNAAGDPHTWVGRITVPRLASRGLWRITWIQVLDRGHNLKTYSPADAVLARAAFNVE